MCGAAGAGKTLITDTLAHYCEGYKWNTDSIYQGLKVLSSSLIVIEEVRLDYLHTPLGKQMTDYTSAAKIEMKNAHPVDATRNCPVVMNTNENIFTFINAHNRSQVRHTEE
jgi:Parvovirus non-structural protein NS1